MTTTGAYVGAYECPYCGLLPEAYMGHFYLCLTRAVRERDALVEALKALLQGARSPMWGAGSGELELAIVQDAEAALRLAGVPS